MDGGDRAAPWEVSIYLSEFEFLQFNSTRVLLNVFLERENKRKKNPRRFLSLTRIFSPTAIVFLRPIHST